MKINSKETLGELGVNGIKTETRTNPKIQKIVLTCYQQKNQIMAAAY